MTTQEDKRPPTSIPTWHSIKQAAKDALDCIETAKRDDGTTFLRAIAKSWLYKEGLSHDGLLVEAHRDTDGTLMLPDDHRYQMIYDALVALSELDADATRWEAVDALNRIEAIDLTGDLANWLGSNVFRASYCDEANEWSREVGILARIQAGYVYEQGMVSHAVLAWLLDHIEPKEEEG